ncbi:FAD:protein FMN transferase [Yoonia sp. SS1-5]|uniref:FAD:protein FMN transferase n=1 Tax=Yoonia rhodophyticola TaxID=3137370 RepID=A0AAN0MHW1_9RHOB
MTLSRRRFLTISAAAAAMPASVTAQQWQGHALGAEVSLTINAPADIAALALSRARRALADIEGLFSLYDPHSDLVALNSRGRQVGPDPRFVALLRTAARGYHATQGLFDPTVQPLWLAQAAGENTDAAAALIGWDRVHVANDLIMLGEGQALTLNGIAQGYATDLITDVLADLGLTDMLVHIGEHRGLGGPWRLGINDPVHGYMGLRTLTSGAIATSSPTAQTVGAGSHIVHARAVPQWSTVSVEATTAAMADCLSTALCLAPISLVRDVRQMPEVQRITLVDFEGNLRSL